MEIEVKTFSSILVYMILYLRGIDSMGRTIKEETGKDFMFSEKFGFIHSCPTNLGTGKINVFFAIFFSDDVSF